MNKEGAFWQDWKFVVDAFLAFNCAVAVWLMLNGKFISDYKIDMFFLSVVASLFLISVVSTAAVFLKKEVKPISSLVLSVSWGVLARIMVDLTGRADSWVYPILYPVVVLAGMYARPFYSLAAVAVFGGLEYATILVVGKTSFSPVTLVHLLALSTLAVLVGYTFSAQKKKFLALEESLAVYQRSKHNFSTLSSGDEFKFIREEGRRQQIAESIVNLQDALHHVLGDLHEILKAHTVILFTLDNKSKDLRFRDAVSRSEHINRSAVIGRGEGILGWVFREKEALRLTNFAHPPENLVYYTKDEKIRSLVAVPVLRENSQEVEGMLIVDSKAEGFFSPEDEKIIWLSARQAMKEIETAETRQRELSEARVSHALYKVSEILNASLNIEQVLDATMDCILKIVDADFAVLALYDEQTGLSTILRAVGIEKRDDIEGKTFRAEESLVGWVTSPERYLFYPDFKTRKIQKPIFGKNIPAVKNIGTFFCYPLVSGSEFLGSLTLTFEEDHALPEYERNALTTLARMAATSIANAYLHGRVAKMATTDGLTGLYNHRYFQERLSERIEEARRHPTRHSLILVDIDHFKKVNDTYGHPVGDEVLKRLAVLLKESVRAIDLAARYGGEEFVLLLTNTDRKGALQLAERVRKEAKKLKFQTNDTEFSITLSMGVATFPDDARTKESLIENADEALYYAKEHGRNKVVAYYDIREESTGSLLVAGRY